MDKLFHYNTLKITILLIPIILIKNNTISSLVIYLTREYFTLSNPEKYI
nr:MAG TPA: hypothetical protein [Caudoviricetes sp.]